MFRISRLVWRLAQQGSSRFSLSQCGISLSAKWLFAKRNLAPGVRSASCVLLLAATAVLGLAGCSSSHSTVSGGFGSIGIGSIGGVTLSQTSGAVGFPIAISGAGFGYSQGTSTVTFNGTLATVTSWNDTYIAVIVPVGATTGNVVVTVSGVASNGGTFTVIVPPVINTLSQSSGAVGTSITITGMNFGATQGNNSAVAFNGTTAPVTSWNATSIVVSVPVGATPGDVVVSVSNMPSNGISFTPGASITSLNQASGAVGSSIQITGTNFGATQGSSTVTFNGMTAIASWSATTIVATVPVGATTGDVFVTVSGVASNGVLFTVVVPPVIGSLSRSSGAVGTSVTITGTNFGASQGNSAVTFNGTTAAVTSWSATSIATTVPVNAITGDVVVTVSGVASNGVNFTITGIVSSDCASAPTGDESLLSGHYVFLIQGWAGGGLGSPVATVLSFAPNGSGGITNLGSGVGGEADTNGANRVYHFTINSTGSLYTVGKDPTGSGDLGCVELSTSLGSSLTFTFSLGKSSGGVYTKGRLIRFDDSIGSGTRGSGVLLRQTAPFGFGSSSQSLVFGENGWDANGYPFSGAGHITMSSSGQFSNLAADFDDDGSINFGLGATNPIPGAANNGGFNASPDATAGYATVTDYYTVSGTTYTFDYAAYQVNTGEYFYVSTDPVATLTPLASGRAIATGSSFTESSLSGNYVVHETGSNGGTSAQVGLGLFTFTPGTEAINGTLYQYEEGSAYATQTPSGTYSIASASGRATLSGTGFGANNYIPILYVATPTSSTEPISGFIVGTDPGATFGFAEASSGTFSTAGLAGNYFFGTEDPGDNTVTDETGVIAVTGSSGACTGTKNSSGSSGLATGPIGGSGCTFAITNSNGTGNMGTNTLAITNGASLFFFNEGSTAGQSPAVIHVIEKQ